MEEKSYQDFFENFKKFKELQNKQKARGLNDFNLLTTVLSYDDEVRLHSRMIGNLLNPYSKHYQGTLFLEEFLQTIKLDKWGLNLDNIEVKIEYHDIDLYITDGTKHIIIENKVRAKDQPCQIIKYINIIKEEYDLKIDDSKIPKIENIYIIYLTPRDKKYPDEHKVENDYIMFSGTQEKLKECANKKNTKKLVPDGLKNYQTRYQRITYKNEIMSWLRNIHSEIRNILNLNEAIMQYKNVVEMVTDEYKGNVMTLKKYLEKDESIYENICDIKNELSNLENDISVRFWNELAEELQKAFNLKDKPKKESSNTKYEWIAFKYKTKKILIERERNLYIYIDNNWNYIKIENKYNQNNSDLIDMKNGNKNFWKLGKADTRSKLISSIIKYINEQT